MTPTAYEAKLASSDKIVHATATTTFQRTAFAKNDGESDMEDGWVSGVSIALHGERTLEDAKRSLAAALRAMADKVEAA